MRLHDERRASDGPFGTSYEPILPPNHPGFGAIYQWSRDDDSREAHVSRSIACFHADNQATVRFRFLQARHAAGMGVR